MKLSRPAIFTALLGIAALLALTLALVFAAGGHPPQLISADFMGSGLGMAGALPFAAAGKTKFFRVATEGATTDGRRIERAWIEQMAKHFNRAKYGARVWLEHYRGIYPDGPFRAYGDVTAVEARQVEDGKLALFAQIDPTPELVRIVNDQKQKVYTSIEVNPKFADSGEAYLVGLAVTDSPASLGTEMLTFAQQHPDANPLTHRKQDPGNLFSQAVETQIELAADEPPADDKAFAARIKDIVAKAFGRKSATDEQRFADVAEGLNGLADAMAEQAGKLAELRGAHDALNADFAALKQAHADMLAQIDKTPAERHSQRPPATGGAGLVLTDC